jgi:cytochrome bd-type quinol oxidase subunit 2
MAVKGWEMLLGEVCILMCLIFSIYYFNKARKTSEGMETLKHLNIGLGILFLFLFISRVIDNPLMSMTNPLGDIDLFGTPLANQQVFDIAKYFDYDTELIPGIRNGYYVNLIFLVGLAVATFFMERAFIPKARHVFFIILVVCAVLSLVPIPHPTTDDPASPIIITPVDIFDAADDYVSQSLMYVGYFAFIVIPIIYFILAGKTTGDLRRNALFLAFGFIMILIDMHTVGHSNSGAWYRAAPCLLGFLFIGLGNMQRK